MIPLSPLAALDPALVSQQLDLATAAIGEDNPDLDVSRRGSVYDILAYYHAVLNAQLLTNVNDYLDARSLLVLSQSTNPDLADPALVDDVVSNFGVTRQPGAAAAGSVAIVVSSSSTLTLPAGAQFQAGGLTFITDQVYTAKVDPTQIHGPGDRLLTPLAAPGGQWRFTVNVVATAVGAAGNLPASTVLTPVVPPANFVRSYAAGSFGGGVDTETNTQLLNRLAEGVACKAPSNRVNFAALLRNTPAFSAFVAQSVVGAGDVEQLRDKHSILPLSLGGKVDWYVRTQAALAGVVLTRTATCLSVAAGSSVWQFSVGRDDAPGFYELRHISRANADGDNFPLLSDVRAVDLLGLDWAPDVANPKEGAYSRFQTAIVQFTDSATPVAGLAPGATASYTCTAVGQPLIGPIQDTLASSADGRSRAADVLVKAPVPCFVTVIFTLYSPTPVAASQLTAMQSALAAAAQNTGFTGQLYASALQAALAPLLTQGQYAGAMNLSGSLRRPDGSRASLSSTDVLTVPDDPANMVSPRTVQFYLDLADVVITVSTVAAP